MHKSLFSLLSVAALALARPQTGPGVIPPAHKVKEAFKVDDGSPIQEYFYKQLSDRIQCTDGNGDGTGCSVGETNSESYTVSWGAGVSAAGWISADFSVSKSISTGNTYTCDNSGVDDEKKDFICVWKRTGYTEYTVQDWEIWNDEDKDDDSNWTKTGDPYQMWSPNTDEGHDYVCAWDDDCEEKGAEWWGPSREPGGPGPYPFDTQWE